MTLRVGTSGYAHKEWKANFYPATLPQRDMLDFYVQNFPTVEINNTFRQLPKLSSVEAWAAKSPESFRFALKGRQAISHFKRLRNAEKETDDFLAVASALGERLGPVLFQLPDNFRMNVGVLDKFLQHVGGRAKIAFDFQDPTWFCNEVFECLRSHAAVVCATDRGGKLGAGLVHTADWGYVRLCGDKYTDDSLRSWKNGVGAHRWTETYVLFSHLDQGISPALAARYRNLDADLPPLE